MVAQHALVTGGSRGIGRAIAAALTARGHRVTIVGRDRSALDAALSDGVAAAAHALDVTDLDALAELASAGGFGILVNNAGAAASGPFLDTSRDVFRRMLALHVESAAEAIRACLPGMAARRFGRIVNVASTAGLKGYPYVSAYVAAKHALVGLTRALAVEVARSGITVNAVCPGYTDTDLVAASVRTVVARTGRSPEAARSHFERASPLGRLVRPEEVADAVVWLAGAGASRRHRPVHRGRGRRDMNEPSPIQTATVGQPLAGYSARHLAMRVDAAVATLTLNRPERKNPLTFESYAELRGDLSGRAVRRRA